MEDNELIETTDGVETELNEVEYNGDSNNMLGLLVLGGVLVAAVVGGFIYYKKKKHNYATLDNVETIDVDIQED